MLSPEIENILEIQKKRSNREERLKLKVFNIVKEKIQNYANFGKTCLVYSVPNFIIGEIPFTLDTMSKYITKKLKEEGFYIINLNIQTIYISWDIKDIQKVLDKKTKKIKKEKFINNSYSAFANVNKKSF